MWFKRYILFRDVRHPEEMAEAESNALSTHLADRRRAGASTRKQALSDLLCLYRYLIGRPVGDPGEVSRARRPVRLSVVVGCEDLLPCPQPRPISRPQPPRPQRTPLCGLA